MITDRNAGQKYVHLEFSDKYQPFVHRHGAFRLVGQGFDYSYQRSRSNQFALRPRKKGAKQSESNESESASLQFNFLVAGESRVPVVDLAEVVASEAIDDQKRSLVPDPTPDGISLLDVFVDGAGLASPDLHVAVPLKAPSKNAKKVVLLKGTVTVQLQKEKKTQVLTEKFLEAKGKKFQFGIFSMTIDDAKKRGDQDYDLQLTLTGDGKKGDMAGDFELLDGKGKAYVIHSWGFGSSSHGGSRTSISRHLGFVAPDAQTGPPTKLVYVRSVRMKYSLPFEFRDLPLP